MHSTDTMATWSTGMSCSVRASVSPLPALRAREEAMALCRPPITGFTSLISVQMAETAIAPAPV